MSGNRASRIGGLALIGILLMASPVRADDGGFTETFDDPGLADWEQQGDAIVEGGILKLSPPSMVTRPGTWSRATTRGSTPTGPSARKATCGRTWKAISRCHRSSRGGTRRPTRLRRSWTG